MGQCSDKLFDIPPPLGAPAEGAMPGGGISILLFVQIWLESGIIHSIVVCSTIMQVLSYSTKLLRVSERGVTNE